MKVLRAVARLAENDEAIEGVGIRCPPPHWGKFFIFTLKIVIFGALWAAIFTVQWTVLHADHAD